MKRFAEYNDKYIGQMHERCYWIQSSCNWLLSEHIYSGFISYTCTCTNMHRTETAQISRLSFFCELLLFLDAHVIHFLCVIFPCHFINYISTFTSSIQTECMMCISIDRSRASVLYIEECGRVGNKREKEKRETRECV